MSTLTFIGLLASFVPSAGVQDAGLYVEGPFKERVLAVLPEALAFRDHSAFEQALADTGLPMNRMGRRIRVARRRGDFIPRVAEASVAQRLEYAVLVRSFKRGRRKMIHLLAVEAFTAAVVVDEAIPLTSEEERDGERIADALAPIGMLEESIAKSDEPDSLGDAATDVSALANSDTIKITKKDRSKRRRRRRSGKKRWLAVSAAYQIGSRSLTYGEAGIAAPQPYEVSLVSMPTVGITLMPLAPFTDGFLRRLSIGGSYSQALNLTSSAIDGTFLNQETAWSQFAFDLHVPLRLTPWMDVVVGGGYGTSSFEVAIPGDEALEQLFSTAVNASYGFVYPTLGASLDFGVASFHVSGAYLLLVSGTDEALSASGLRAQAALRVPVVGGLSVQVQGGYTAVSQSFGPSSEGLAQASDAADTYTQIGAGLRVAF